MIPAEEALAFAIERRTAALTSVELSDEELVAFHFIDSTIESGIISTFNGDPFDIKIPADIARSAAVIEKIRSRYNEGRWIVGVFPVVEGDAVTAFQMVFAPKEVAATPTVSERLPTIVQGIPVDQERATARLLLRMPTRGRPAQALQVLAAYRRMAGIDILMEVVVDTDDETITSEVLYRLHALGVVVTFGEHKSKIEACNGGRLMEWDIIVLASDDMWPVKQGWAKRIVELYAEHWPHFTGALHLDDGYAGHRLCTLPIMGRRLYWGDGSGIYHHGYKSLFCDDEYTETLSARNRILYLDENLIEHRHPAAGKAKMDALYVRNDALWNEDEALCNARREMKSEGAVCGFEQPAVIFSILICTQPTRYDMLERLLDYLSVQTARFCGEVEIVVDHRPAESLGEKRQRLLDRAIGKYVAFVDDDDFVAFDYVDRIVTALRRDPEADCTSLVGIMTTNGNRQEMFEHSLKYSEWKSENGKHQRNPNHLNAIRTSIARKVGFENLTYTEDHAYSRAVLPLLKREVSTGDVPLYHYFYVPHTEPMAGEVK